MRNAREFLRAGLFQFLALTFALLAMILVGRTAYAGDAGMDTGVVDAGPLAIIPPSATVAPLGKQKFTASGGSGMGYVFSLSAAPSGGTITAAGAYKAGATAGVTDMVQLVDSAMNTAMAAVTVTAGVTVAPSTATVAAGGMQTFVASGGSPPYTWTTTSGSGAPSITAMGVYTAGAMAGMDVVTATDSVGGTGTATVTVAVMMKVGIGANCTNADGGIEPGVCPAGATCVDGVCCSTACTGQCQACNTSSMLGTCVTITGTPVGARPGCNQSDPANVCTSMTCDGTSATACTSFVGTETTCGIASCIDGLGTPGAVCEGDGGCVKVSPASCGVYGCVADMCATTCNNTSECSPGNFCDVKSGKCVKGAPVPDSGADAQSPRRRPPRRAAAPWDARRGT